MPTYDYYSETTCETKEVFHGMNETPEILDSKGNIMKIVVHGGTGFTIKGGGTRRRNFSSRYGNKVKSSQPTPGESAAMKATEKSSEAHHDDMSKKDPYYNFRD